VQVLHDAFFKCQTKPKLTSHGDLYYEGKEFEVLLLCSPFVFMICQKQRGLCHTEHNAVHVCTQQVKLREMKPGMLSRELKEALGMPDGAPPPWLINMQVLFF
jgi:splicing factor 3B subunit 2